MLGVALLAWLGGAAPEAPAQLFGAKKMAAASTHLGKQKDAVINKSVEPRINADNSYVMVSLSQQRALLKVGDEVYIDTPISSGKRGHETPKGRHSVLEKDPDHRSSIYGDFVDGKGRVVRAGVSLKVDSAPSGTHYVGAPMKWFMRLTDTGVGMHIGILPGYAASHGCVRLPANIAKLIFDKVKVGTPVTIED
jgi:lipoprotein-anchoring transpeptidase ErfK/SrfK